MRVISLLVEFFTQSKKNKLDDEAMDRAHEKVATSLEELKVSNAQLTEALKDRELHVRKCG